MDARGISFLRVLPSPHHCLAVEMAPDTSQIKVRGQKSACLSVFLQGPRPSFFQPLLALVAGFSEGGPQIRRAWLEQLLPGEQEEETVPPPLVLKL